MRDFFQGWRRKAGIVALVITCGVAAMSLRSLLFEDLILIYRGGSLTTVSSLEGHIEWNIAGESNDDWMGWEVLELSLGRDAIGRFEDDEIDYKWERMGFIVASGKSVRGASLNQLQLPHWSLIFPLTLLSAYLIFWKPRKYAQCGS
jgi:hypothetical protein